MQFNNYIIQEQISKLNHRSFGKQRGLTDNLKFGRNLGSQVVNSPPTKKEKRNATLFEFYFDVISELPI